MGNSLAQFIVDKDIYGQPITVMYKGSDVFKTKMGAFLTLVTYALIVFNLATLLTAFADGSRQEESSQTIPYDLYTAGKFPLKENMLELSFVTINELPKEVGQFRVRERTSITQ